MAYLLPHSPYPTADQGDAIVTGEFIQGVNNRMVKLDWLYATSGSSINHPSMVLAHFILFRIYRYFPWFLGLVAIEASLGGNQCLYSLNGGCFMYLLVAGKHECITRWADYLGTPEIRQRLE
jgi:hypothetical protein